MSIYQHGPNRRRTNPYYRVLPSIVLPDPIVVGGSAVMTLGSGDNCEEQVLLVYRDSVLVAMVENLLLGTEIAYTLTADDLEATVSFGGMAIRARGKRTERRSEVVDLGALGDPVVEPEDPEDFPANLTVAFVSSLGASATGYTFVDPQATGVLVRVQVSDADYAAAEVGGVDIDDYTVQTVRGISPFTPTTAFPVTFTHDVGNAVWWWQSGGRTAHGQTAVMAMWWNRTADGVNSPFFSVVEQLYTDPNAGGGGGEGGGGGGGGSGDYPLGAADTTLGAATQSALITALNTRISSGSTLDYIIDLPSGNYGNLNLSGYNLPGRTYLRSQNQNLGAKFGWINLSQCRNIIFHFVDADATLRGAYSDHNVAFLSSLDCGIEYSRIYAGPIIPTPNVTWGPLGSHYNIRWNVRVDNTPTVQCQRIKIHMNYIHGVCEKSIYHNGSIDGIVSDNVFANVGGDQMYVGWGSGNQYLRNWGARLNYPSSEKNNPSDPYDHGDFFQSYSPTVNMTNYQLIGNVYMMADGNETTNHPHQGIFGSQSRASGWLYENNIVMTNSVHGVTITGVSGGGISSMTARYNSAIWCADAPPPGNQYSCTISIQGGTGLQYNVQSNYAGNTSHGANGLNMPQGVGQHTSQFAYYTNPIMAASFYDLRPVSGQVTHWAYSGGTPIGAAQRFYDVIVSGAYPKIGPATAAWKTWYDPTNQITS